jgi:uncharacterized protein YoxC
MSVTGAAALIAALSFAVLALAGVYLAVKMTRVLGAATVLVRETRAEQQAMLARANAAVDRANAQLDRTDAVVASMDELGAGVSELAGQVSTLAGLGRSLAAGPVGRTAALAYGIRHAVALRRAPRPKLVRGVSGGSSPLKPAALPGQIVNGVRLPSADGGGK